MKAAHSMLKIRTEKKIIPKLLHKWRSDMVYIIPSDPGRTHLSLGSSISTGPYWDHTGHNACLSISQGNWFLHQGFCSWGSSECFPSQFLCGLCPHSISPLFSHHPIKVFSYPPIWNSRPIIPSLEFFISLMIV